MRTTIKRTLLHVYTYLIISMNIFIVQPCKNDLPVAGLLLLDGIVTFL
jgi:hypothetical protein